VETNNKNIITGLEYSTVQFDLSNLTPNDLTIEIDTNTLTDIPATNGVGAFPNTLGQTICGGIMGGLYYNPTTKKLISGGSDVTGVLPITQIIDASSGLIESTVTNTIFSSRMQYVDAVDRIYSIQNGSGVVSILNPATGAEVATIPTPAGATTFNDMTFSTSENKLYLMDNSADQRLYVLDVFTNTYLTSIALGGFGFYATIEYAPTTNRVYAGNQAGGDRFQIINSATDTIVGTVPPFGVGTAQEMKYNPNNNTIYFNDFSGGNIRILDMATELILFGAGDIIPFAGKSSDMTFSSLTNTLWVVSIGTNITVVDCSTNTVSTTLLVPAVLWSGQVEYAEGINTVYTSPRTASACIQQIDASGNQFFVEGSSDINLFIRDTLINPKQINRIMLYAENITNLANPLTVSKEDANGMAVSFVKLPNTSTATSQIQSQIGQIDFENYIFDVTSKFIYEIPALTTVRWVIYYQNYERGDMLANKVMINEFDAYKPDDPNTYDEAYLMETSLRPSFEKNEILNINS
jgi:hypothetical protein